jgi:hypothetical protein
MLVLLGLEEAKRDALLAPTKCELGISEVPQSRDPHFPNSAIRNSKSPIPIRISQIPQFEIRNSQFEIPNPYLHSCFGYLRCSSCLIFG